MFPPPQKELRFLFRGDAGNSRVRCGLRGWRGGLFAASNDPENTLPFPGEFAAAGLMKFGRIRSPIAKTQPGDLAAESRALRGRRCRCGCCPTTVSSATQPEKFDTLDRGAQGAADGIFLSRDASQNAF